ncbi:MBL fold metallo-hydrolase [Clostridium bovifaecis]|uniref:MBL fold metallo-hydrolase n=1 Tax=Clostridium bovifaecis TaxID=2184719 RepID=A0A6I6EVJ6_9CLOT|nr:MBL fold metallo-hydrolase [Clostridium bovifaecis]
MITELLNKVADITMKSQKITPDIILLEFTVVNACILCEGNEWFLVDTGLESSAEFIIETAEKYFKKNSQPKAIILTHGHFDHIGSVIQLVDKWKVPVYAHELEMPYLTGKKDYAAGDSTVDGGLVAEMSPAFPHNSINLGNSIHPLPSDGSIPAITEWRWIHTPGHTPGHISLFRDKDKVLIVGDAFTTVKQESLLSVLTQRKKVSGPPAYLTTDWKAAETSVKALATLEPSLIIPSHGIPMRGKELNIYLGNLASHFEDIAVPEHGRFVE